MLKKVAPVILLLLSPISFAGSFYLAPTVVYTAMQGNKNTTSDSISPRLTLGYQNLYENDVSLAGEIFVSPTSFSRHNSTPKGGVSLKSTYQYGASILPGLVLDQLLTAYARIGVIVNHFKDADITRTGYQAGLGMEVCLTPVWSMRAEYAYARYGSVDGAGSVSSGQYLASAVYKFG